MSLFGPKSMTFTLESKSDPRWNFTGVGKGFVNSGKNGCPEAVAKVEELKAKLGEIPADLEYSYWKD